MIKLTKDVMTTVRINSKVKEFFTKKGMTVQQMLDQFVWENLPDLFLLKIKRSNKKRSEKNEK